MFGIFKRKLTRAACLFNLSCSFKPLALDLSYKNPQPMRHFKKFSEDVVIAYSNGINNMLILQQLQPKIDALPGPAMVICGTMLDYLNAAYNNDPNAALVELDLYEQIYAYMKVDLTFDKRLSN